MNLSGHFMNRSRRTVSPGPDQGLLSSECDHFYDLGVVERDTLRAAAGPAA
jgi:hypothetical protein